MIVATLLFSIAAVGLVALLVQLVCVALPLERPVKVATRNCAISILKPLCGIDDGLEENLERFATLDYPRYELLLGVKDEHDPAWPLARAMAKKYPRRV